MIEFRIGGMAHHVSCLNHYGSKIFGQNGIAESASTTITPATFGT